jgi:hypothetical protein
MVEKDEKSSPKPEEHNSSSSYGTSPKKKIGKGEEVETPVLEVFL